MKVSIEIPVVEGEAVMFSVLIRYKKSRREVLIPARTVEFIPEGEKMPNAPFEAGLLINHTENGGHHLGFTPEGDEDWRDVFVMNAAGQTVARYTL